MGSAVTGSAAEVASRPRATSLDRITLSGLRARGHHGVLAAERDLGQEFVVDATLWLDLSSAASHDDVTRTVHYGELAETLAGIVTGEPVNLIETLADRLVRACLRDGRVMRAEVTVHKPAAPIAVPFADVAVTIVRNRVDGVESVTAPDAAAGVATDGG